MLASGCSLSGGGTHHKEETTREHGMQQHIIRAEEPRVLVIRKPLLIDQALAPAELVAAVSKGLSLHRS